MMPVEARASMLQIRGGAPRQEDSEDAEEPPLAHLQLESGSSFQIRNFTGCLLWWDQMLFRFSCVSYVLVSVFLFLGGEYIWFGTLMIILAFVLLIKLMEWCSSKYTKVNISNSTVDRLMFWIPYSFFCLYTMSIIHRAKAQAWYIQLDAEHGRTAARVGIYVASCTAVVSLALGALKVDSNANASVSRRMSGQRWYTTCHVVFRVMEISSRIGIGVFLCESLRVQPWASRVPMPVFLCMPFAVLVLLYSAVYQLANAAGGKPFDSALPCLAVGVVTLVMNPMHFFTWPGYVDTVRKVNKCLFLVRMGEVVACVCFMYTTPYWDTVHHLDAVVTSQTLVAFAVHWLMMGLHSDIKHSTCQALVDGQGLLSRDSLGTQMAFPPRPGPNLFALPQSSVCGLCQAWVRIGGGLHFVRMEIERPVKQLDEYQTVKILGGGAFGVVVKVEKLSESREPYAMKLLDTSQSRQAALARREAGVYCTVWDREHRLADGLVRVGHPFIVRLHFWSLWDEGREFRMNEGGTTKLVKHPCSTTAMFHMALMMEQCDGNLGSYMERHFRSEPQARWHAAEIHFLAEILLALEFLHERNVVYRDLKPENVLTVSRPDLDFPFQCHCKLGDFGYSRVVNPGENHDVSMAGSPYFCAPEMELRVQGASLEASQAQENSLDTYSYGTLAYVLAYGPGYMGENNRSKLGNRKDHPRCQRRGAVPCRECGGCELLARLEEGLRPMDQTGYLADLIRRCVARRPEDRPAIQGLRSDPLFLGVNFEGLLHLRI